MKILCSRQPKSDEAFFQSIIGKDIWVKVKTTEFAEPYNIIMIHILSEGETPKGPYYKCNFGPANFEYSCYDDYATLSSKDQLYHCSEAEKEQTLNYYENFYKSCLKLIRPIEVLTTDEYFVIEEYLHGFRD